MAKQLAIKTLHAPAENEKSTTEQEYFRDIKDIKLKAGETAPGGTRSALHLAQGELGWTPGRHIQWFEKRKLGLDRTLNWEQFNKLP